MNHQAFGYPLVPIVLLLALLTGCVHGPRMDDDSAEWAQPRLAEGISKRLAYERSQLVGGLYYDLKFNLSAGESFRAECRMQVDLNERPDDLVIDFRGSQVFEIVANQQNVEVVREANHIIIPGSVLNRGENNIFIDYAGEIGAAGKGIIRVDDKDDGSTYLYTLNVPADGHALFPCFDQPDLKAQFKLTIDMPEGWRAISNAPVMGPPTRAGQGYASQEFKETATISTYLFAFAAGPFVERSSDDSRRKISCFARKSQAALLDKHVAELTRLHRVSLDFLERWFDFPYPFQKFDFVIVPDFPFSGMEHPGCIFYGEDPTLFRNEVTRLSEAGRADLIAHETAHMWFGDLVTMPWFDDVWLKEGFATFMAHKVLEATFSGIDHNRNFFLRNYVSAIDTDATPGTTPMRQPLANMLDAKSNYGPIIYRKGPAVLRALEYSMGEDAFQRGSQLFLKNHAFSSGSWPDLKEALEEAGDGPGSLDDYGAAWIEGAGIPEVMSRMVATGGPTDEIVIDQQSASGNDWVWPLTLSCCWHGSSGKIESQKLSFDTPTAIIRGARSDGRGFSYANHENRAYARFRLSPEARDYAIKNFASIHDALLRTMLWESIWYEVEEAELSPIDYLGFVRENLFREDDQRLVSTVLSRVSHMMSRYLSDTQRDQLAPLIEGDLAERIFDKKIDRGMRLLLFRAYPGLVHSPGGARFLRDFAGMTLAPPGIEVSTRDRWAAVTRLMLLGDEEADRLFALLRAADSGDEGRRRAFMVECARPDVATKRTLFARFFNDATLPERWVQDGVAVFFASEQAALTDEFVGEALAKLDWIKANRKIFFLAAWLDGVIRSRLEAAPAALAWDYVEATGTQDDVRKKLLVPLTHLERTVRVRAAFARD